ncbi:glycosyltransferase family 1 protein [Paracoccus subflavus]|uniref:Glycosyltransferase family 1 protein n=1 Tax=Paracoccus subflavus TaxID=2528244 RepID=A0A4Q9G120_9RHOB|nr:glycosyltransferase [Paracoccus subflavus]TBN38729.1 glycosyltransferase family 1 protein [Paracoccus subflavus]
MGVALRYLFLCPEVSAPSGGVAVIYACVEMLRGAGYDAAVLHARPDYRYGNTPFNPPVVFSPELEQGIALQSGRRRRLHYLAQTLGRRIVPIKAESVSVSARDVLVVPEFMIRTAAKTFPEQAKVIFSQNSFSYIDFCHKALMEGFDPDRGVICNIGINETSMDAFALMSHCPQRRIVVSPNLGLFSFGQRKRPKIAYMPRKRKRAAEFLHFMLSERGLVSDFELVSLDRMPQAEVARHLHDSLIFVSLMKEEALGFPGIEAMASGCIVVGYTGLGTEEYFTPQTGFPVREGDTAGLVMTVERVAADYRRDPAALDALRRHASELVRSRYNPEAFRSTLLAAWADIDGMARSAGPTAKDSSGLALGRKSVN